MLTNSPRQATRVCASGPGAISLLAGEGLDSIPVAGADQALAGLGSL